MNKQVLESFLSAHNALVVTIGFIGQQQTVEAKIIQWDGAGILVAVGTKHRFISYFAIAYIEE